MIPELKAYIDNDGLVGQSAPPAGVRSGGNQLLETWTGWVLMKKAGVLEPQDIADIIQVTNDCEAGEDGIYDKNPPNPEQGRRMDDITHDDMLGVAMGSAVLSAGFEADVVAYGRRHGWRFSNNGKWYYTASAKPWHRSAYLLAAGEQPDDWSLVSLLLYLLANAFIKMDDASGKRLAWLILEATEPKNHWVAMVGKVWRWRISKTYGSIKRIFIKYHGEKHPFVMLAPE